MKTIVFLLFALLNFFNASSQQLMTIREVFDFEVGDEFQYRNIVPNQPPNADRITITNKYYSTSGDTLFYIRYHDSYYTVVNWNPQPHLDYFFQTKTDTIFLVDLDSIITKSKYWAQYDSNMYVYDTNIFTNTDYCDSLINGYHLGYNSFEPEIYERNFGKGLGRISDFHSSCDNLSPGVIYHNIMFYYNKNGIPGGTPDSTGVSVQEFNKEDVFEICPNPNQGRFYLIAKLPSSKKCKLEIFDIQGSKVTVKMIRTGKTGIDLQGIAPGIYLLRLTDNNNIITRKVIIE